MDENKNPIAPYKPKIDVLNAFEVDQSLGEKELTFSAWQKLVQAKRFQDLTFIAIGKILKMFRDQKLYKNLDFDNFSQFLASEELSFSREKAYVYIRIYEIFVERLQISQDELSKIGIVRLMFLAPVVRGIEDRDEAIKTIDENKDLRYNDFVSKMKSQTNKDGKPTVFWSEEAEKWIVNFYEDKTHLVSLGNWEDRSSTE
jgi:hypothetical protein